MSTVRFVRRARREAPRAPGGELTLQPPPEVPRVTPANVLMKMLPVVMVLAMVGMMALLFTSGGFGANPMSLLFPAMMVLSMVGMFAGQGRGGGAKTAELNEDRKDYLRYLDQLRRDVESTSAQQRAALLWSHPQPELLWTLAGTDRMWERRTSDPDHCHVRVGRGSQRLATRLVAPETGPVEELDPVAAVSLRRFVRTHAVVADLPTAVSLRSFAAISIDGDRAAARALVRAMLLRLSTFHGPDQLVAAVVCGPDTASQWEWCKWLPHVQHPREMDGAGARRMVYGSIREFTDALGDELRLRARFSRSAPAQAGVAQLILVVDGGVLDTGTEPDGLVESGLDSVTVLDLSGYCPRLAANRGLQLVVSDGRLGARSAAGLEIFATADQISVDQAQMSARRLAPYRTHSRDAETADDSEKRVQWPQLIGIVDPGAFDPDVAWRPRHGRARLRVPFGVGADGSPVELDLKEAAENGMGPHGLCIGATGSGKSEFLRTLVLGLLATHSPQQLNLVLVDFKGGATFLGLDGLPHVAAVITNLEEETALVDRMRDALAGELNRRQELLRAAGNFANVSEYEKARAGGADLDPLPALFVVIDEFSELLSQQPEFADLFVAIGRLGRSLHIHLLLASQRLDEGRLRGLDSHLSYRIGLKTFSANESRAVIGVPDAYHLPAQPGAGYLKSDAAEIQRFQALYVSGPYEPVRRTAHADRDRPVAVRPRPFTAAAVVLDEPAMSAPDSADEVQASPTVDAPAVLTVVADRMRGHGRAAHRIWLPPLNESPTLDALVAAPDGGESPPLRAVVGLIDRPFDQRRDRLTVDLSGGLGNVAVVGGPQSGKSTALRTLVVSMALTHSPKDVQFYCLDFGGGTLSGLAGLPHVGSVAGRMDRERVRRTVAELTTIVRQRESLFRALGIESIADYRRRRAKIDSASQDPFGDVFLVIDGFASIRQDFEQLEQVITNLAAQGLSYGVHVVLAASRWAEVRPALKDQLGTRIELRLGDPSDSDLGRRLALLVPQGRPGRGMTRDGLHLLLALPRIDGKSSTADLRAGVADAVARIAHNAAGRSAPAIRMLPEQVDRAALLQQANWPDMVDGPCQRIPVGINESELAPAYIDFGDQPHLLIFGDSECGKTTLLRGICESILASNTPQQAKLVIGDYRRTMLGVVETEHLAAYAPTSTALAANMNDLADYLRARLPRPDADQQQLRTHSWSGPQIFVIIDDYDLVVTSAGNPVAALLEFLPQAKDIGLHLIVARRSGGAARAMFEPVIARLRDVGAAGVVMSGSREEGPLVGDVRASAMPPGRGTLVTRGGAALVQFAWNESR
ncbi:type VII secretion protein EccCa [Skermania sp. ID1734]|uniref:type VII secretion protein EccCa n=1 Tax=Skermania sp. ID1734 TaxID=2597516 RepID=UPI00117F1768|nr:type VII secretion protein EccCa [Skermania sp. ID1734]TSE02108.1 type VII secretion protein EccCa [Skermania sp. ID1734]